MKNVLVMESGSFRVFGGAAHEAYDIYQYLKRDGKFRVWAYGDFSKIDPSLKPITTQDMLSGVYNVVVMNSIRDVPVIERYVLKDVMERPRFVYIDRGNVLLNFDKAGAKRLLPKMVARQYLMGRMRRWLDCYVALSAEQYEFAKRFFTSKTTVVYLPITPKVAFRRVAVGKVRSPAIYVGRLDEKQKKVGRLISGVACAVQGDVALKGQKLLNIVGGGPDEDRYKSMVKELKLQKSVMFLGVVSSEKKLARLYNSASFFVSHSEWEGMSATFLEAMACGLPMLISQKNNTLIKANPRRWLVEPNYNGVLFDYDSQESFARAFILLYKSKKLRDRLGANSYRLSRRFSKAENLRNYDRIIERLAHNASVPKFKFM